MKYMSESHYCKSITLVKETPRGMVAEIGIIDYNVNPEHISKNILIEIEEQIKQSMKQVAK